MLAKKTLCWRISVFFKLRSFISAKLCFAQNTIKLCFQQQKTALLCITDSKTPLSRPLPKMALLQPKVPLWVFPMCLLKPLFLLCLVIFYGYKNVPFSQTDRVNGNAFFTFRTQIKFANFSNKCHLNKKPFQFTTTQKHNVSTFFENVLFYFSSFLFFFLKHKKDKTKNANENFFDTPTPCKKIFSHPYTLFVI